MSGPDALIHLANFLMPALAMALLLPLLARLVWWRSMRGTGWVRQFTWLVLVNTVVLLAGVAVAGRDGAMGTYLALVLASSLTVWWTGLR